MAPNDAGKYEETILQTTSNITQKPARKASNNEDETTLIYQQLVSWLDNLALAKLAGQAGSHMTTKQQAVLPRQLTMITDIIEKHTDLKAL